jgi:hypothetical protein
LCSVAQIEMLAEELRQLKSGIEHAQARLAFVLAQFETALQGGAADALGAPSETHAAEKDATSLAAALASARPDRPAFEPGELEAKVEPEDTDCEVATEATEEIEAEAEVVVEPVAEAAPAEGTEAGTDATGTPFAPVAADEPIVEIVAAEALEVRREPARIAADAVQTAPPSNVIVLYEHPRIRPQVPRSGMVVAGRWAASIAVIATIAAIAAAGTGLARREAQVITGSNASLADFMQPVQAATTPVEELRRLRAVSAF